MGSAAEQDKAEMRPDIGKATKPAPQTANALTATEVKEEEPCN